MKGIVWMFYTATWVMSLFVIVNVMSPGGVIYTCVSFLNPFLVIFIVLFFPLFMILGLLSIGFVITRLV